MSGKAGPTHEGTDSPEATLPDVGNEHFADRPHWLKEALATAVSWCTIFPVRAPEDFDRTTGRRAMGMLPAPGVILGVITIIVAGFAYLVHIPPLLLAVLIVALWQGLTRMMHIDGLADVADALGSYSTPSKAQKILSDTHTGAMGVVACILVLGIQVAAVTTLLSLPLTVLGILAVGARPIIGRIGGMVTCARPFSPFRAEGFGGLIIGTIPKRWIAFWAVATTIIITGLFIVVLGSPSGGEQGFYTMLATSYTETLQWMIATPVLTILITIAAAFAWAGHLNHRFKGLNGDCTGSTIEVSTTVAAVSFAVILNAIFGFLLTVIV